MSTSARGNFATWAGFSAFQVFGDHAPLDGFQVVVRLQVDRDALARILARRAGLAEPLDPDLAQRVLRAGMSVMTTDVVSFVHATIDGATVILRPDAIERVGASHELITRLVSAYAGRLALLLGHELPVIATVYEFPNLVVVRRAFAAGIEQEEDSVPHRSAWWLGSQLTGRGESFHPAMIETLEEQTSFLGSHDIDIERLPPWWWRGLVARAAPVRGGGSQGVEVIDDLPGGDEFAALVVG
jgi:hypothetical protein